MLPAASLRSGCKHSAFGLDARSAAMRMAAGLQVLGRTRLRDSRTSTGDGGMEVGAGVFEMVHVNASFHTVYSSYFWWLSCAFWSVVRVKLLPSLPSHGLHDICHTCATGQAHVRVPQHIHKARGWKR